MFDLMMENKIQKGLPINDAVFPINEKLLTLFMDAPYLDLCVDLHQQFCCKI
jgi:hypothetical protein